MISLGVDIGGTGAKCVAFDDHGAQLALSYIEYPNPPGKANLEPQVLSDSVVRVIRDCVQALPARNAVAAITVSSFGESFVPIDEHGAPLTDIIMYFANSESGEFDELVQRVGEETFMRIARILPDASYSLAKMLYTLRTAARPVWKFLPIAAYVCYRLSGAVMTDVSLACRTLLYDVERREWSRALLEASGVNLDQLPEVCPTGTAVGFLRPEIAQALGLSESVRVVIGSHDQIVNALACGVSEHGDGVDVSGTCECIEPLFAGIPEDFAFTKENFACVPYVDNAGYVTYAYNISGGAVVRWYRDQLAKHLSAQAKAEHVSIYAVSYTHLPYPYTVRDAEEFITAMLHADQTQTFAFAIVENDVVIGSAGIFRCGNIHFRTAELGYYLGETHWGRGFATRAVRQACAWVFAHTDILRIFAEPFAHNAASCRVLEKAGFQLEGTMRANAVKNGKVLDMKMYAILKDPEEASHVL